MIKDRIKELRRVKAKDLKPSPRNWRRHPKSQRDAMQAVLAEIGYADALLARETSDGYELIDGHLRAEITPDDEIPVLILDVTEAEADKILATLDPLAAMAEADTGKLEELLHSIQSNSPDFAGLMEDLAVSNGILPQVSEGGGGDDFDVPPEDEIQPRCKLGELWVIDGKHRLLIGDCTVEDNVKRLMDGETAQAVLTDPPYGQNQAGVTNDEPEKLSDLVNGSIDCLPVTDAIVVCFQSPRTFPMWLDAIRNAGHKFERMLWLDKVAQCAYPWRGWILISESILVSTVGKPQWNEVHPFQHDIYRVPEVSGEIPDDIGWHGSVKPIAVVQDIMSRISASGDLVYDPFLGSGTTLIAAHREGRICYGCEIDPKYGEVILRRAEAEGLTVERG